MFYLSQKRVKNRGYTLVELLIVVAIISIMSVVSFSNYGTSRKNVVLRQEAQKVILDLRQAQNMAMNTVKFNGQIPSGGYGIRFDVLSSDAYIIYADTDNSATYSGAGEIFITRAIGSPVIISGISIGINLGSLNPASPVDINFVPPDPKVKINTNDNYFTKITLRYGGAGGPTKDITINGITGQISGN
ncbi:type II secretion system GspH family protein [Patescibacteria group bacterium]|nr:type II secretion system GspH family protein [Patescibacteria group bacterium]MBU4056466.1 type II secretion system GspH family protein [Patescibacteria group bacterium]